MKIFDISCGIYRKVGVFVLYLRYIVYRSESMKDNACCFIGYRKINEEEKLKSKIIEIIVIDISPSRKKSMSILNLLSITEKLSADYGKEFLTKYYLISCSSVLNVSVLKKSYNDISKPSHNFLIVTMPAFILPPFIIFFNVEGGTAEILAKAFTDNLFSSHNSNNLFATAFLVSIISPLKVLFTVYAFGQNKIVHIWTF